MSKFPEMEKSIQIWLTCLIFVSKFLLTHHNPDLLILKMWALEVEQRRTFLSFSSHAYSLFTLSYSCSLRFGVTKMTKCDENDILILYLDKVEKPYKCQIGASSITLPTYLWWKIAQKCTAISPKMPRKFC